MASGSSGGGGGRWSGNSRRRGAQQRLTVRQMQTGKNNRARQVRRMRIARIMNAIPF